MGKLTAKSIYPHLSQMQIDEIELFNKNYSYDKNVTQSDKLLEKKLNQEADVIQPIMSSGWRCSDIESLESVQDIRVQNIIASRLVPTGDLINTEGMTDEQLIDNVIPRNLLSSTVSAYADEANYLKQRALDLIAEQKSSSEVSSQTAIAE